ncbi:VWA domain-containing protein [Actinoplanes hulinensis]|uniref:VWA domain-containing protein n=1 Tax=Actinoplanes hulinensis TaxID=1144547 RepID=A0ABS7AXR6_9ACTN|nr:vWA domain-containing protein [Actinoplanes hulinensis]MBW6433492.1 VWA domain-containing protein [Actinoplanes hulinensis]
MNGRFGRAFAAAPLVACALGVPVLPARAAPSPSGEVEPIHLAIAVDESGSLSDDEVRQERIAAASVAIAELSPQSDVTVFGFGSNAGNVQAVDPDRICELAAGAGAAARDAMVACVQDNIRRRTGESADTDFVAALGQGVKTLTRTSDDRRRILLLLTDGQLDVRRDGHYGSTPEGRQREAEKDIRDRILPEAKDGGVQIWPLGFGDDVRAELLDVMAAQSAPARCSQGEVTPEARLVADGAAAVTAMMDAFVKGRCLNSNPPEESPLPKGKTVEFTVTVPAIATDGAINVTKGGDERIKVEFIGPDGKPAPATGTVGDTTFELAGSGGLVESLRMRNPASGTWRVKLTAPADANPGTVTARVVWQGVLHTVFVLDPPSPRAGETVSVFMRPHTRTAEIGDPSELAGYSFAAQVSGTGLDQSLRLADDGAGADEHDGDTYYSASFTLPPTATGSYRVVGNASGPGVVSDQQETTFRIAAPGPQVRARILLDATTALPGAEVTGTIQGSNGSSAAVPARIVLTGGRDGTVTVTPAGITLAAGASETGFTLTVADNAAPGPAGGIVQVLGADRTVLGNTPLNLTVLAPPSLLERYGLYLLAVVVVLATLLAVLLLARRRRRAAIEVKGLTVALHEDGRELPPQLVAPAGTRFEFDVLVPDDGSAPALRRVSAGSDRYRIERGTDGSVRLFVPDADTLPDSPFLPLAPGAVVPLPRHPRLGLRLSGRPTAPAAIAAPDDATLPLYLSGRDDDL